MVEAIIQSFEFNYFTNDILLKQVQQKIRKSKNSQKSSPPSESIFFSVFSEKAVWKFMADTYKTMHDIIENSKTINWIWKLDTMLKVIEFPYEHPQKDNEVEILWIFYA